MKLHRDCLNKLGCASQTGWQQGRRGRAPRRPTARPGATARRRARWCLRAGTGCWTSSSTPRGARPGSPAGPRSPSRPSPRCCARLISAPAVGWPFRFLRLQQNPQATPPVLACLGQGVFFFVARAIKPFFLVLCSMQTSLKVRKGLSIAERARPGHAAGGEEGGGAQVQGVHGQAALAQGLRRAEAWL